MDISKLGISMKEEPIIWLWNDHVFLWIQHNVGNSDPSKYHLNQLTYKDFERVPSDDIHWLKAKGIFI